MCDMIDLCTWHTLNGRKPSITLVETGIESVGARAAVLRGMAAAEALTIE